MTAYVRLRVIDTGPIGGSEMSTVRRSAEPPADEPCEPGQPDVFDVLETIEQFGVGSRELVAWTHVVEAERIESAWHKAHRAGLIAAVDTADERSSLSRLTPLARARLDRARGDGDGVLLCLACGRLRARREPTCACGETEGRPATNRERVEICGDARLLERIHEALVAYVELLAFADSGLLESDRGRMLERRLEAQAARLRGLAARLEQAVNGLGGAALPLD